MKQRFAISIVFLFVLFLFGFSKVEACSCARSGSPVVEYKSTPIVFIGTVKSVKEDKIKIERFGKEVEVRTRLIAYLDIEESFKGVTEKKATILTGGGGGDCGFHFEVGKKYFIFASPLDKNNSENIVSATVFGNPNPSKQEFIGAVMTTHICTLTNGLQFIQDELEIIRAFLKGKPEPRIYGNIREYVYEFDGGVSPKYIGQMSGIMVVAEGAKGKFEAKTDDNGKFSIKDLPIGKYNLKFLLPPTHTTLWSWEKLTYPIELKSREDSINFDLSTQIRATIGGTVFNSQGKPVGDDVQLSLIPIESANKPISEILNRSEYTKKNGKFVFDGVKPGKYILGINAVESPARNTPYPKTYFPSGNDVSKAKVIEITIGQKLENLDFRLPKELLRFVVEGVVRSANGKPIVGADLDIYDSETPKERVFGFSDDVKTDAQGRFKITGFKGRRYLLHAYKDTDYLAGRGVQSERVEVVFDETAKNIKLVLNKNGIFVNQIK
jgi:hypothetical protein